MGRIRININRQCGDGTTQSSRSDTGTVNSLQNFFFQFAYIWNVGTLIHRPSQSLLCHQGTFLESASDSHTDYQGRTGIRPRIPYSRHHCIFYSFNPIRRLQHKYPAHILASEPLGRYRDLNPVAGHYGIMDDCRCVILCVFPVNRILYHRFS